MEYGIRYLNYFFVKINDLLPAFSWKYTRICFVSYTLICQPLILSPSYVVNSKSIVSIECYLGCLYPLGLLQGDNGISGITTYHFHE